MLRYLFATLGLAVLLHTGVAAAASFTAMTDWTTNRAGDSSNGTTNLSESSFGDDKIVLAARDDAARFVASVGQQRGVYLEAALLHIRSKAPQLAPASDLQLAEAILTL